MIIVTLVDLGDGMLDTTIVQDEKGLETFLKAYDKDLWAIQNIEIREGLFISESKDFYKVVKGLEIGGKNVS